MFEKKNNYGKTNALIFEMDWKKAELDLICFFCQSIIAFVSNNRARKYSKSFAVIKVLFALELIGPENHLNAQLGVKLC